MTDVHMMRVFTDVSGKYGDVASVIVDESRQISDVKRQKLTRELETGETAFINDVTNASISIMHPQGEIDFAGVAALATAWLLGELRGEPVSSMKGRGGAIAVRQKDGLTWVQANLDTMPPWHHKQLASSEKIEQLNVDNLKTTEHTMFWAWIDEAKGLVRARTFANDWDIRKQKATARVR